MFCKLQNFYWQARRAVPLPQQSHLFLFDPGQIRYCASVRLISCFFYLLTHHNDVKIYTPPPNEISGYAPDRSYALIKIAIIVLCVWNSWQNLKVERDGASFNTYLSGFKYNDFTRAGERF